MNDTQAGPRSLQSWLDEAVRTPVAELRGLAIRALSESGVGRETVVCGRCTLTPGSFTFTGVIRHLMVSESNWQLEASARGQLMCEPLHQPGDLRAGTPADPPAPAPWTTESCRSCGAQIIWALTARGKRMPVDLDPNPMGNVLLTAAPGDSYDLPPLAMVLHSDADRSAVNPEQLRTTHFQTCPNATDWRRPR